MEGTNNNDEVTGPRIDPVEGSDGGDLTTRQLDDGDEVMSMATPTLDERDGMSSSGTYHNLSIARSEEEMRRGISRKEFFYLRRDRSMQVYMSIMTFSSFSSWEHLMNTVAVALSFTNFGALQNPNRRELGLQILISCSYVYYLWYTQAIW